ncbi:transcriptional regulator [Marinobacter daepoensis]|uniref:transcriptional regulator n=1 Tax=Marinobacter daepoensis TaxID=262077 RepID=UPI001C977B39|nr:transcriptional regulator [Marinobacter daepoensis]MBY6034988.1 transcriptional regulator [Marinobacter daepoensis]
MSSELATKLRLIREAETSGRAEFSARIGIAKKTLEGIEQTGRVPRGDLLEKVCQEWPKYTLWLMTGEIIPDAGQISPEIEKARSENSLKTG